MNADILDSSAWLECLEDGPNTRHFRPIFMKLPDIVVPAIVLTEVRKVILRQRTRQLADKITRIMLTCTIVSVDEQIALDAAELAINHRLPLADSLIYATTLARNATLWTQDNDFEGLPQVRYFEKTG